MLSLGFLVFPFSLCCSSGSLENLKREFSDWYNFGMYRAKICALNDGAWDTIFSIYSAFSSLGDSIILTSLFSCSMVAVGGLTLMTAMYLPSTRTRLNLQLLMFFSTEEWKMKIIR